MRVLRDKRESAVCEPVWRALYWAGFRKRRKPPTLGLQLLVIVNGAMAVLLTAFLVTDYRRELRNHLNEKRVALQEEAKTILPAVVRLRAGGPESVQEYLDAVCARMRDIDSPGHHIAVRTGSRVTQSTAHGRSSPDIFRAMHLAASLPHKAVRLEDQLLVTGSASSDDATVYVSEDITVVRRDVLSRILWRLAGILAMGIVAALLVSFTLLRTVVRPVERFVAAVRAISRGEFETRLDSANSRELASLGTAITGMSESLRLAAQQRQSEMTQARKIQEHLLPTSADVPGMKLAVFYHPAADVAGDYYDVLKLPDGSWLLCIADVCGHGVPAAMSAAMLKSFLMDAAERFTAPDEILQFVNRRFIAVSPPGLFASMLLARWQPQRNVLQYASAGHEPALLLRRDAAVVTLEATGFLLGIESDATWSTRAYAPRPGDRLLAMTDGAVEAMNPHEELFGRPRVRTLLASASGDNLEEVLGVLDRALSEHRSGKAADDDTTILAAEFAGRAVPTKAPAPVVESGGLHHTIEQGMLH